MLESARQRPPPRSEEAVGLGRSTTSLKAKKAGWREPARGFPIRQLSASSGRKGLGPAGGAAGRLRTGPTGRAEHTPRGAHHAASSHRLPGTRSRL